MTRLPTMPLQPTLAVLLATVLAVGGLAVGASPLAAQAPAGAPAPPASAPPAEVPPADVPPVADAPVVGDAAVPAGVEEPAPAPDSSTPEARLEPLAAPLEPASAPVAVPPPPVVADPVVPPAVPEGEAERIVDRDVDSFRYRPGKGFELKTDDGDFALGVRLWGQFLYTFQHPGAAATEDRHTFQIPRARLAFAGNLWGEETRYKLELGLAPRDVGREPVDVVGLPPAVTAAGTPAETATARDVVQQPPLLEWYVEFAHLRDLNVRVGQSKVPFSRQRMTPDSEHQFVDGRITSSEFNLDRDLGIDLRAPDFLGADIVRYYAGVYTGEGRSTSDKTLGAGEPGFLYLARVEVLPFGMFADYSEADFERTPAPRLSLGAAYALVQGDAVSPQADAFGVPIVGGAEETPLVDFTSHNLTLDAVFKASGLSAATAFHYRKVEGSFGAADPQNGLGWMIQAGYLVPRTIFEFVGAYAILRGTGDTSLVDRNEVGLGLNAYFIRHFLKLQLDVFHLWAPDAWDVGDDQVRLQLQASL